MGAGPAVLRFNATAGTAYAIDYKDEIGLAAWNFLTNVPAGAARVMQVNDPTVRPYRFYRLRTPQ